MTLLYIKHRTASTKSGGSKFRFVGETISELKKVVWLSRREAFYLTVLVLVVAAMAGLILTGLDYGFARLVNGLFLGG